MKILLNKLTGLALGLSLIFLLLSCGGDDGDPVLEYSIIVNNNMPTDVTITLDGVQTTIVSGDNYEFKDLDPTKLISYSAQTAVYTTTGDLIGETIQWNETVVLASQKVTVDLDIESGYFYLNFTNKTINDLWPFWVNYGLSSEKYINGIVPGDNVKYALGYFKSEINSNIRFNQKDNQTVTYQLEQGVDFSLTFGENNIVEISF